MKRKIEELLEALPLRVRRKITKVSAETGQTTEAILEAGVRLYEQQWQIRRKLELNAEDALVKIQTDPEKREIYLEIMRALNQRRNQKVNAEERSQIAQKGGRVRAQKLTAEEQEKIARKAANTRWSKKDTPKS